MGLVNAARQRLSSGSNDGGFALLTVMMLTLLIMIGSASTLLVVGDNIVRAGQSRAGQAALTNAQSGIQTYVAQLNANPACAGSTVGLAPDATSNPTAPCQWLLNHLTLKDASTPSLWNVTALNATSYLTGPGTLRISATGTYGKTTKTLLADVSPTPSALRFAYFSDYETVGKTFLDNYYRARTITINDPVTAAAAGISLLATQTATVTWDGDGAPTGTDSVCNMRYYPDPADAGAHTGRASAADDSRGTDYTESGSVSTPSKAGQAVPPANKTCDVAFSAPMTFNGPVYSRDALLFDNGAYLDANGNRATAGPTFNVPTAEALPAVSTGWTQGGVPGPYRLFPLIGGAPQTTTPGVTADQLVRSSPFKLALPTTADPDPTPNRTLYPSRLACTYSGPTRIKLSGSTATVVSPLTAPGASPCYTAAAGGGVSASVPVVSTTLIVGAGSGSTSLSALDPALVAPGDITTYSGNAADAYIEGSLTSGQLSVVAGNDIIVTGNVSTAPSVLTTKNYWGETARQSGPAVDLVATNNVRVFHPVACAGGTATNGFCPNDISGLYSTNAAAGVVTDDGTLRPTHPSLQYCNLVRTAGTWTKDCTSDNDNTSAAASREIDAAVFALNGSFVSDNFDRGRSVGRLKVVGGVYQNHHGPLGKEWESPMGPGTRHNSGYKLQIDYLDLDTAVQGTPTSPNTLPYVPPLQVANPNSTWQVVSVSTPGGGS